MGTQCSYLRIQSVGIGTQCNYLRIRRCIYVGMEHSVDFIE